MPKNHLKNKLSSLRQGVISKEYQYLCKLITSFIRGSIITQYYNDIVQQNIIPLQSVY